ncbi:GNAT family N-acetyltransferase [Aquihabitans sp. G128]|uniref:GNAT family N-acetyltransferase n=1 Tax=Aquihabitans sp. G128 TaxID=2849779 RepID=UPI001C23D2AD|nr:GNAT family N-acetyltransferase [Aquihabitans sp. G128]QXC60867.1 GNAT family N-acetyltransferase [Aquihabitans sp. G128]
MTVAHPLDNAVWRSLTTGHGELAEVHGRARRYPPDVSPFAAVDGFDDEAWDDLATLAGPGGRVVLFRDRIPSPPAGWRELLRGPGHQLVLGAGGLQRVAPVDTVRLTERDVPEILALVRATEPGPFLDRTVTMGRYHGHVHGGRLVAMAGERLHPAGFTEISAVCTAAHARGRGLASALTQHVADAILARGEVPLLHVASTNAGAQRVYERLGFEQRRVVDFVALAAPPDPARADGREPSTQRNHAPA